MSRRNWLLAAGILIALGVVAALVIIKPLTEVPVSKGKPSAPPAAGSDTGSLELGLHGDILDEDNPGISLSEAREKAADGILIPSSKVLGNIVRVRLTEEEGPQDGVGIGILYDSGVKFFATPGLGKDRTLESIVGNIPQGVFSDGRKKAYDVVDDRRRKYMVMKGGTQGYGDEQRRVAPRVVFVVDGTEYRLFADSGNLNEQDLLEVAKDMR